MPTSHAENAYKYFNNCLKDNSLLIISSVYNLNLLFLLKWFLLKVLELYGFLCLWAFIYKMFILH